MLYFGTNHGRVFAVSSRTGDVRWTRSYHRCIAATPAASGATVYVSVMDPSPCSSDHDPKDGYLVALDAATGRERWRAAIGVTESSPLVVGRRVYVGSWDGRLYALDRRTGAVDWSFRTEGKVKDAAAFANRTVVVGSYDGRIYALDEATGTRLWSAALGAPVYASPVIASGLVVVGDLGGSISAFRIGDGSRMWSIRTGSYVYSSAAVWRGVAYVGSYDGRLYALDVATGHIRWTFDAGGPVSGTPTVVGGIVYFARCSACFEGQTHLDPRGAFGVNTDNGRLVWRNVDGEYTPIVSDGRFAYLVGYSRLSALDPIR
jgi:outer membrane protein assembly factor BamB